MAGRENKDGQMDQAYEASPADDIDHYLPPDENEDFIEFFVCGDPKPQGSTRSYYVKKIDRVVTIHGNKDTKKWQLRIATEAQHANEKRAVSFYSPDPRFGYEVEAEFVFQRPKSLPKKIILNTRRPDVDKLVRTVLDGLAKVLIPDDSQVVSIITKKRYAVDRESPGVRIAVRRLRQ
ncbi:MAG: RusA family crossover junction endodeoxyribonuclease [Methanomassiliicoccales archaeon]|jgi:Holliday junction resolvase RusA-like endonuclease|nr:RusA family crossover junction endodeoxyribonuclease [Methanomassiliicoccales archaeon]